MKTPDHGTADKKILAKETTFFRDKKLGDAGVTLATCIVTLRHQNNQLPVDKKQSSSGVKYYFKYLSDCKHSLHLEDYVIIQQQKAVLKSTTATLQQVMDTAEAIEFEALKRLDELLEGIDPNVAMNERKSRLSKEELCSNGETSLSLHEVNGKQGDVRCPLTKRRRYLGTGICSSRQDC
ncbi:unnamed protein product [Cylindrotheca closterium]|uniref:Uncharacterized protein n=1 Tax=Cylindrotheca closterium TaxID=2856 RepID=A0AAD2FU29_9STRA|nr:unnamed protein product [Cylindrotheca closterium]CAJ1953542.1 unnamed protein product [Cylindrotheca closterium]